MSVKMTIDAADDAELCTKLAETLQSKGWLCIEAPNLETPAQVAARFALPPSTLCKRLKLFRGQYPGRTGPTGRILCLHVTPELADWLAKTPRRTRIRFDWQNGIPEACK